jgi:hypothetical protein
MEYYVIRIYRRVARRRGGPVTELTGLLEDGSGRKKQFQNAEELWRLLSRGASDIATSRTLSYSGDE